MYVTYSIPAQLDIRDIKNRHNHLDIDHATDEFENSLAGVTVVNGVFVPCPPVGTLNTPYGGLVNHNVGFGMQIEIHWGVSQIYDDVAEVQAVRVGPP